MGYIGDDIILDIRRKYPGIGIISTSCYDDEPKGINLHIQKPFSVSEDLVPKLEEMLRYS